MGRPNAGKSSIINAFIGEDRYIVTDIAGTTRDSIYTRYDKFGFNFYLVDTAGIRKKGKVTEDLEYYSVIRSIRAIEASDVCILKFIEKLAEKTGLSTEYIESNEQKRTALDNFNNGYYSGLNNSDELFIKESNLIKKLANKESCVIIGRCADFILKDNKNVIKIFINNNMENKIKRATEFYGMNKEKAEKEITRINKLRANHYKYYTEREWKDPSNYNICINSDAVGIDNAVELICNVVKMETVKK